MRTYCVRIFAGIVLVLSLTPTALSSTCPRTTMSPPMQAGSAEWEITQVTDLPDGIDYYENFGLSGNGKKVLYSFHYVNQPSEMYSVDARGATSPQFLDDTWLLGMDYYANKSLSLECGGFCMLVVNGQTVTPCVYNPENAYDAHCLEQTHIHATGSSDSARISGDGSTVFFVSDQEWECTPFYDDVYDEWKWNCLFNKERAEVVWRIPSQGGTPTAIFQATTGNALYLQGVSYDGSKILVHEWNFDQGVGHLYVVSSSGNRTRLDVPSSTYPFSAKLSPDGNRVVFTDNPLSNCCNLYTMPARSNATPTQIDLPDGYYPEGVYDVSDDASWILWRNSTTSGSQPCVVKSDGSDLTCFQSFTWEASGWWNRASISYNGVAIAFRSDGDLVGNGNTAEQVFVARQPNLFPDLVVAPFTLDTADIVYAGGRFTLPVDAVVYNEGETGVSNVVVRFSDNSGWSTTQTIASLDADASTTLHLDWDITDLLMAGNGQATAELTVTADPDDTIAELTNLNNTASASLDVDARPRITAVRPTFTLDKAYFLDNETVSNLVKVYVDWNGDLAGDGDAPYGDVYFNLNGTAAKETGQSWGAQHPYDMGSDFQDSFSCANNTLRVWATYPVGSTEFRSLETAVQPTVFPWPGWVEWAIQNIPGSDASFEVEPKPPLVQYTYDFKYPEPAFEATWTPPDWVPYLGGKELGILPTQARAEAEAQSDGSGAATVSGETGLGLAAVNVEGSIYGKGETQFTCGESFDLQRAELGLEIRAPIEKEAGLVDLIPGLRAAEDWPVVGRIIRWVNNVAQVKAAFTPAIEVVTEFKEQNDQLEFTQGTGTGSIDANATLAIEPCEGLEASVYGGGKPYITLQVPKNPGYLQKIGIQMYYGASFEAWAFEAEYERRVDCSYPGSCQEVAEESAASLAAAPAPDWRLIPRTYAGPQYATRNTQYALMSTASLQATSTSTTILLTNIYPRPEPALALRADGRRLLAYVHDDTAKPQGRGTEIYSLYWDGSAWSGPTRVTDDAQPDFSPAVAYDGSGTGVLVWERSALATGITPTLNITFARSLEIAASTWNGTSWSTPVTLTNDGLMDHAPRLSAGSDGTVMALWETTDGTDALGTATHPLTITYALWNGSAWGAPTAALTGLHDVLGAAFAAYSSTQAALVYAVDGDGLLTTTADSDLYYSTFDGTSWSGPTRLTNDTITDTSPALAYDSAGRLHLLWLRGDDSPLPGEGPGVRSVWLKDSWNLNDAQTVRSASTEGGFLGFTLSRAANGNLAIVWQGMGEDGADLSYSVYDAAADSWGADNALTSGADVEADHSPAFGSDSNLYAAYRLAHTEFVTQTFTISPTYSFTVTNLPQEGQSDLMFLAHTVGHDLTFDSLTITPTNPAAGQAVTLTAVLRNAGDLSVNAPQVAFYDGASQIGSTQTLSTLAAGYTATVQAAWTVPSPAAAHTLKAVADPGGQVTETDETNNEITLQTTLPDLRIDLLYTDYDTATITATARLVNDGVLAAGAPFTVAFRAADPLTGTLLGTALVGSDLEVGGEVTVTLALTDPLALAGLGTQLWAVADSDDVVAEADEGNNTAYAFLPLLPDLTLTAGDITGDGPVLVVVRNAGVVTATAPVLSAWSGGLTGTLLYSGTLSDLGPGETVTATLNLSPGAFELWVKADPDNLIAESSEGNNLAVRAVEVFSRIYLPLVLR